MNFYQQIGKNKRNSWILVFGFLVFAFLVAWIFALALEMPKNEQFGFLGIFGIATIIYAIFGFYSGDRVALSATGAKEVAREGKFLPLHRLVENVAITAGIPKPRVFVINDNSPNAFATGRDPEHASVAVTLGLLNLLNKRELEAVIAHEISHIRNFDIRFAMLVTVLVGVIAMVADVFRRMFFLWRHEK
jgi:heat shock protein HtpX